MTGCTFSNDYKEDYNILENNSIRFIKSDASISFLINKDNTFYLLVLNGTTVTDTDYLIKIDNTKYNINYTFLECDFIYLYDIDKDFYITIDSNLLVLFYDAYTKFNYKFMYELSKVWIDSYTISNDSYTTLTIYEDNFCVSSYKIRGKTIHKK